MLSLGGYVDPRKENARKGRHTLETFGVVT